MAEIKKAEGIIDWLDQRLAVKVLTKVLDDRVLDS